MGYSRTENHLKNPNKNILFRYAFALLTMGVGLFADWLLLPALGTSAGFVSFLPAIAFSAWCLGLGPSILTTIVAFVAAQGGFFTSVRSLLFPSGAQLGTILAFLIAAGLILTVGEASHRRNERLRREQGALEDKVRERTTELDSANQSLRELSARLMQLQDEERRRIARELHDSVGQMLAGLTMNLSSVKAEIERLNKEASKLTDSEALVQEMSKEVRTISYLLHPPLLDEAGLSSALRWYVEGFSERSKIKVDFDLPIDFGRLPAELETAIFRTVQECLTNVHRHSESAVAKICLARTSSSVRVEVQDSGKGMAPENQAGMAVSGTLGVGLRGMRERLRQLGGNLEVNSSEKGTTIVAELPIANTASEVAAA